ncbi:hypothetical protein KA012_04130 [Candidatus Woesebacteria bacterium]|nr:hypothetical protein [Candidatus Woesebacteria bacterium]
MQFQQDLLTFEVDGCNIKLSPTPLRATLSVNDQPLHLDLQTEPISWTGGNTLYSHADFEVEYQSSRKTYDEDKGFVLCPEDGCQSPEMMLEPLKHTWSLDQLPEEKCAILSKFVDSASRQYNTIWPNFTLGSYKGLVMTRFPDESHPFESSPNRPEMTGVFFANDQFYYFYLEPTNSVHLTIIKSFNPR